MLLDPGGERLVGDAHDAVGERAIRCIPPMAADRHAQDLDIDTALVHFFESIRPEELPFRQRRVGERRAGDDVAQLRERAMRMDVDGRDASACDRYLAPRRLRVGIEAVLGQ